jgi:hypothetical protein
MSEVSTGFKARLEYVLDQICVETEHGGSHEMRSFIAEQLMATAQAGERSFIPAACCAVSSTSASSPCRLGFA